MKLCGREELDRGSRICDAGRPPRQARPDLRHDRGMDQDQDQVRGHGHPEPGRRALRSDPVDEGDRRGAGAARDRHRGRGRPPDPRQVPDRRQPDQAVGFAGRGAALAAARRAHRRDPRGRARLLRGGDPRAQGLGRARRGATRAAPSSRRPGRTEESGRRTPGGRRCASSSTVSRPSARRCSSVCSSARRTSSACSARPIAKAARPIP